MLVLVRDLWARVRREYTQMGNVALSETACNCLTDTENNGINTRLEWIAKEYVHHTPICESSLP